MKINSPFSSGEEGEIISRWEKGQHTPIDTVSRWKIQFLGLMTNFISPILRRGTEQHEWGGWGVG